jgi:hypothetical protein
MFVLGHIHFKYYTLWVTVPPFTVNCYSQRADNLDYYEVLLSTKEQVYENSDRDQLHSFYVDIMSDPKFKIIMQVNDRNQPISEETDMIQYQSYIDRKGCCQPLYKLSKKSVEHLISLLQNAEG